ncbi:MAG: TlpA disulfide reductase family protein [Sphingobacteriaceae bacterium]|jgi:peroxiredoxin
MKTLAKQYWLVALLLICTAFSSKAQTPFPNVTIQDIDGKSIQVKDIFHKNEITIVSLWATWCTPCQNELDELNDRDLKSKGIRLIAVSEDDARTVGRVKSLANGKSWNFDVFLDPNNDLKRALNVGPLPFLAVVKDNSILYTKTSYTPGSEDELIKTVEKLK